jgi:hypothetical protein
MQINTRALVYLNILATISCIALAVKFLAIPSLAKVMYQEEYKSLMYNCDNAMRNHMIAKNRVIFTKTKSSIIQLKSAEMGLLECHEYDKLRKLMISKGLNHNDLSMIGLEAIEEKTEDLMKYVEIHEFKY